MAVIGEGRRRKWEFDLTALGEKVDAIASHRRRERRALFLKVRHQLAKRRRVEHGSGEHVRAGLARFLEHRNCQRLSPGRLLELRQSQRRGKPRRPRADDQDVEVEGLASHRVHPTVG